MNGLVTFFRGILEVSLFASAMIAVVLLIRKITKDRISIKVVSFLWLLVIVRLCLPGMLESPVHVDTLFPAPAQARQTDELPLSQSDATNFYENSAVNHTLTDSKAATPSAGSNRNQTTASESQTVAFYEQVSAFVKSLDLWLLSTLVWLIGGAMVLASVLKESVVFNLRTRRSSEKLTDTKILGIVAAHQKALRLQRSIRVSVCSSIQMPLAFGVLRPHILLPARMMEELGQEHLEAILLHEVCHIKRNDILKSHACVLARALHWFNPLVWISLRMVRKDMEFACDQRVLSLMKTGQVAKYCESLLMATRFMKQRSTPALVTPLCESKSNLKERILKMVAPQKKSRSATAISLLLAMIMLVPCFTTACQPTPEQGFVQPKNKDELSNLINQTNQPGSNALQNNDIPENVSDTVQSNDLTVDVNAKVIVPQTNAYPVVYAEPIVFTQEQADLILDELIGDAPLVSLREQDATALMSKEQIIDRIGELTLMLQDGTKDENEIENINQQIAELEKQLETAPETVDLPYIDREFARPIIENSGTIVICEEELAALSEEEREAIEKDIAQSEQMPEVDCEVIEGACDLGKSGMASIAICNKDNPIYSYVYFVNTDQDNSINNNPEDAVEISLSDDIDGIDLSAEEGYALALQALSNMNISEMELVKVAKVPLGNARNDELSYCYEFIFSRPIGGIPSTYALAEGLSVDNERVSETWDQEYIEIYVDDSGILKFNWDAPAQLGKTINKNVSLKPFDEILSIFKQQILNHCVFTDEAGVIERRIIIDEIKLGMMKIKQQDSGKYIYVPVWDFFGYSTNTYDDTSQFILDENGQMTIDSFGHSFLTINAIDGSIIDRGTGY